MANRRQKMKQILTPRGVPSKERHAENLRYLTRKGWNGDPTNKKQVSRIAADYRSRDTIKKRYGRTVSPSDARLLRQHGFAVEGRTLILDKPRRRAKDDPKRGQLAARMSIQKDGTVKYSYKQRRDFIVGFTPKQKSAFDKKPKIEVDDIITRLKKKNRELRRTRKKAQIRLQWGAFESRKDFSPTSFAKFLETARKVAAMLRRKYGPKVATPLDKLTGVHVVFHISARKKK